MQPAFFSLLLTALHLSILVNCRPSPGLSESEQDVHQRRRSSSDAHARGTHLEGRTSMEHFYSESIGPVRKGVNRGFLIILPIRRKTSNFVSIFDMKRKRFLCLDFKGELFFNYRKINREECLFQRIWLDTENHHAVYYSSNSGLLLKVDGAEVGVLRQEKSLKPLSASQKKLLLPLVRRPRRSQDVNPSDPLRSESHPTNPVQDHQEPDQPEQDQATAGAVSKETITSCDDPLKVLQHSNRPISPVKTNIAIAEQGRTRQTLNSSLTGNVSNE